MKKNSNEPPTKGLGSRAKSDVYRLLLLTFAVLSVMAQVASAQIYDASYRSILPPTTCGTRDELYVIWAESPFGYSCIRTFVFPQFAIGNGGWTTEVTGVLPVQPVSFGLVQGIRASVAATVFPGDAASVSRFTPCLGLWEGPNSLASHQFQGQALSGGASRGYYTSLSTCPPGSSVLSIPRNDVIGEGPMQVQVYGPNATAMNSGAPQLSYYFQNNTTNFQVTVNAIDVLDAKNKWTAALFQANGAITAFSVVNMSTFAQAATITLRDNLGNMIGTPRQTPILSAGCGCNYHERSAPGGFYARLVRDVFGDVTQNGTIEFSAPSPIIVLVLKVVNNSLGAVPAF